MRFFSILALFFVFVFCLTACQGPDQPSTVQPGKEGSQQGTPTSPSPTVPPDTPRKKQEPDDRGAGQPAPGGADKTVLDTKAQPDAAGEKVPDQKLSEPAPAVQDRIVVARFSAAQKGSPQGWEVDIKKGPQNISVEQDGDGLALHLISSNNSFGLKKEAKVNIREYRYLNWRWKAVKVPRGGDVRNAKTDDQAIQLYLAFPSVGWPASLNTPVIGYVWDSESPRGYSGRSLQLGGGKLRYLVLRNKTDNLGEWYAEKRNVYEDYKRLFKDIKGGEPEGVTHGIQIHINSQHTGTEAESYIGEIFFTRN
jgi:hypothetical protein